MEIYRGYELSLIAGGVSIDFKGNHIDNAASLDDAKAVIDGWLDAR